MAEQTSCTKPGRVSSIEREPPPMLSFASNTTTEWPARARVMAAASPFGPAPITTASYEEDVDILNCPDVHDLLTPLLPRTRRNGRVILYITVRMAALYQMFFACDHCRRGSIQINSICTVTGVCFCI